MVSIEELITTITNYLSAASQGDISAICILVCSTLVPIYIISTLIPTPSPKNNPDKTELEEEEKVMPRDFTVEQLRAFDGIIEKQIYVAMKGDVFDVSSAQNFYGPGAGYHCFAGREASRAMAKMSFEEDQINNLDISDLNAFERSTLDDWYEKFKHYKSYPIVGRVSTPPSGLAFSKEQLRKYDGKQEVPAGRVDAPIYVALKRKVLDVSFGGKEMYGEGGPYHLFAGYDASKALAKMSFELSLLGDLDLSDLSADEQHVLDDWTTKLSAKYPVVGELVDDNAATSKVIR